MRAAAFVLFAFVLFCRPIIAQDLHFSQFYHQPQQFTPAATGMFRGTMRGAAIYRSQWTTVPVNYQTFSGAFDWKVRQRGTSLLAAGFSLTNDQAGDAALTWTQAGGTVSVVQALGEAQALSLGFGVAFAQRSFTTNALKFQNQWDGDIFSANAASRENFNRNSGFVPTLSAGLQWQLESADSRNRLSIGAGAFHLNRPKLSFRDDTKQRFPIRFAINIQGAYQLNENLDLVVFALGQGMQKAREITAGGGVRRVLTTGPGNATAVQFSLAARLGDALIPAIQVERNEWTAGLSYDLNTSDFNVATGRHGGLEIAVVYRKIPVPPVKVFKSCPIF